MAFLLDIDLVNFYPKAINVEEGDKRTYLQRANAFCKAEIGGIPPTVDDDLKAVVAMAFEIFAQGETAQIEDVTGNITEAAPPGQYTRNRENDPLDVIRSMLRPYRLAYEQANAEKSDRGVLFL